MTLDICKAYASAPKASFDAFWNDGCCAFVKPPGKCGRPADAKACVVNVSFGDINISPTVEEGGKLTYGEIAFGNFGGIQQCGSKQDIDQGNSQSSSQSSGGGHAGGAGGQDDQAKKAMEAAKKKEQGGSSGDDKAAALALKRQMEAARRQIILLL